MEFVMSATPQKVIVLLIMKNMTHLKTYLAVATLAFTGCQSANNAGETAELWYAQPAKEWMESYLSVMVGWVL